MKNLHFVLFVLFAIMAGSAARADDIPEKVMQRVQADLKGKCLENFLAWEKLSIDFVFAIGELNSQQYCGAAKSNILWSNLETTKKEAIAACESAKPQGGPSCEVYSHNNEIVYYVSSRDRIKMAKKLLEAGDIPTAKNVLEVIAELSSLSPTEKGDYEYLLGKVWINSKTEQLGAERINYIIGYFNHSWSVYKNVNGAVEEGNLRMMSGDMANNWRAVRDAYQFFLANASDEQKLQHPEAEKNLKQTEPFYLADLADKERAAKEQARLDAIKAEQQAKQERLDKLKAEREARQQEKIRRNEEKRQAKLDAMLPPEPTGDGSEEDVTCKSYGARRGTSEYINCRLQLEQTKQVELVAQRLEKERQEEVQKQQKWEKDSAACKSAAQQALAQRQEGDDTFLAWMMGMAAISGSRTSEPQTGALNNMNTVMKAQMAGQKQHEKNMVNIANSVYTNCMVTKGWQ